MEKMFEAKVHLELWVKVKSGWADDERALRSLGYTDDLIIRAYGRLATRICPAWATVQ
jgi:hypothetical protein